MKSGKFSSPNKQNFQNNYEEQFKNNQEKNLNNKKLFEKQLDKAQKKYIEL